MTLFSSLVFFFFVFFSHWFGRLPLRCAGVVGVFPKNLVQTFKLTVTNNRVFVPFVYLTTIISTRKISRSLSSPSLLRTIA